MNLIGQLILLFITALVSSTILIKILIKVLPNFGVVDIPSSRRAHEKVTPRGGGLGLMLVLLIAYPVFEYLSTNDLMYSVKLFPAFCLVALISFLDDIKTIPILIRFLIHLLCSAYIIYAFLYPLTAFHQTLPLWIDFILAIISLTAFLNIYNFLDGIDGITAVQSIHLSITMLILCYLKSDIIINAYFVIGLSTLICACSCGFLMFNWPPAKIFLGDIGSISLGFLIGLCMLLVAASSERLFASVNIASLYYLADGGITIVLRLVNKEKIWQPHLKHFFQQAVKKGMSHEEVVKKIILCNLSLMMLAIYALYSPITSIVLAVILVAVTLVNFVK